MAETYTSADYAFDNDKKLKLLNKFREILNYITSKFRNYERPFLIDANTYKCNVVTDVGRKVGDINTENEIANICVGTISSTLEYGKVHVFEKIDLSNAQIAVQSQKPANVKGTDTPITYNFYIDINSLPKPITTSVDTQTKEEKEQNNRYTYGGIYTLILDLIGNEETEEISNDTDTSGKAEPMIDFSSVSLTCGDIPVYTPSGSPIIMNLGSTYEISIMHMPKNGDSHSEKVLITYCEFKQPIKEGN